jgi:autotransporter-associated beta strand protein
MRCQPNHPGTGSRAIALLLAGFLAALLVPRLSAQVTRTYSNGQTDTTDYSTAPPNDPTTLTIASGSAVQSGILSGTGAVIKTGAGTLTLNAGGTFTGGASINAGTVGFATDLTNPLGTGTTTVTPGSPSDHVKVTLPGPGTRVFVRLKVTQ